MANQTKRNFELNGDNTGNAPAAGAPAKAAASTNFRPQSQWARPGGTPARLPVGGPAGAPSAAPLEADFIGASSQTNLVRPLAGPNPTPPLVRGPSGGGLAQSGGRRAGYNAAAAAAAAAATTAATGDRPSTRPAGGSPTKGNETTRYPRNARDGNGGNRTREPEYPDDPDLGPGLQRKKSSSGATGGGDGGGGGRFGRGLPPTGKPLERFNFNTGGADNTNNANGGRGGGGGSGAFTNGTFQPSYQQQHGGGGGDRRLAHHQSSGAGSQSQAQANVLKYTRAELLALDDRSTVMPKLEGTIPSEIFVSELFQPALLSKLDTARLFGDWQEQFEKDREKRTGTPRRAPRNDDDHGGRGGNRPPPGWAGGNNNTGGGGGGDRERFGGMMRHPDGTPQQPSPQQQRPGWDRRNDPAQQQQPQRQTPARETGGGRWERGRRPVPVQSPEAGPADVPNGGDLGMGLANAGQTRTPAAPTTPAAPAPAVPVADDSQALEGESGGGGGPRQGGLGLDGMAEAARRFQEEMDAERKRGAMPEVAQLKDEGYIPGDLQGLLDSSSDGDGLLAKDDLLDGPLEEDVHQPPQEMSVPAPANVNKTSPEIAQHQQFQQPQFQQSQQQQHHHQPGFQPFGGAPPQQQHQQFQQPGMHQVGASAWGGPTLGGGVGGARPGLMGWEQEAAAMSARQQQFGNEQQHPHANFEQARQQHQQFNQPPQHQQHQQQRFIQPQQQQQQSLANSDWFYKDPQGNVQGPFRNKDMREWSKCGYFSGSLPIRQGLHGSFVRLSDRFTMERAFLDPPQQQQQGGQGLGIGQHQQLMQPPAPQHQSFQPPQHQQPGGGANAWGRGQPAGGDGAFNQQQQQQQQQFGMPAPNAQSDAAALEAQQREHQQKLQQQQQQEQSAHAAAVLKLQDEARVAAMKQAAEAEVALQKHQQMQQEQEQQRLAAAAEAEAVARKQAEALAKAQAKAQANAQKDAERAAAQQQQQQAAQPPTSTKKSKAKKAKAKTVPVQPPAEVVSMAQTMAEEELTPPVPSSPQLPAWGGAKPKPVVERMTMKQIQEQEERELQRQARLAAAGKAAGVAAGVPAALSMAARLSATANVSHGNAGWVAPAVAPSPVAVPVRADDTYAKPSVDALKLAAAAARAAEVSASDSSYVSDKGKKAVDNISVNLGNMLGMGAKPKAQTSAPVKVWGSKDSKSSKSMLDIQQEEARRAQAVAQAQAAHAQSVQASTGAAPAAGGGLWNFPEAGSVAGVSVGPQSNAGSGGWAQMVGASVAPGQVSRQQQELQRQHQIKQQQAQQQQRQLQQQQQQQQLQQQRAAAAAPQAQTGGGNGGAGAFGKAMSADFRSWAQVEFKRIGADIALADFCYTLESASEVREYMREYLGSTPQVSAAASEFIKRKWGGGAHGGGNKGGNKDNTGFSEVTRKRRGGGAR